MSTPWYPDASVNPCWQVVCRPSTSTSTPRRPPSGSSPSTPSSTNARPQPGPLPHAARCCERAARAAGRRAAACAAPTTSTRSRPSASRGSPATSTSSAGSAPTSAGTRRSWCTARSGPASASAATSPPTPRRPALYEVGFNHFFRGKDHPGGGDQIFFQGHASPGMYARAFLEGRLTEDQLDGFRQELSHPGGGLPSLPAPAADAGLLGVPDRLDGPRPAQRDLPGAVQPLPAQPRHQGHQPAARVGVPRRRRDGRAGVARRDRRWPPARSWTTSPSSSTATCSASTARSAATARSSRSWSRSSAAPAGTSSR